MSGSLRSGFSSLVLNVGIMLFMLTIDTGYVDFVASASGKALRSEPKSSSKYGSYNSSSFLSVVIESSLTASDLLGDWYDDVLCRCITGE